MAGVAATWAAQAPAEPVFVPAFAEAGDLVFAPPDSIEWDTLLPPGLRLKALEENAQLRRTLSNQRGDYGTTERPFSTPLYPALLSRSYYLLDSTGVRQFRPTGLKGFASIRWRGPSDTVDSVQAYGYVKVGLHSSGGIVLISPMPRQLEIHPSALSPDTLLAPRGGDYFGKGTPFRRIVRQYLIQATGPSPDRWVFVQWLPDSAMVEAGCSLRYELFHLEPEPASVASLDSGCDV